MKNLPRILWITDPWNTLDHNKDTSLRLMQEGAKEGYLQFWCDSKSIRLEKNKVVLESQKVISIEEARNPDSFILGNKKEMQPSEFSSIHYRTDPPVDSAYLDPLRLLALGLERSRKTEVINPLPVLLQQNEKIEAAYLSKLMPPSCVSSQWEVLSKFGKDYGRTVLKPLHEAQSHGIELLDWRNPDGIEDAKRKLEQGTKRFYSPVILQTYLEGIIDGEVRLWFLDGRLLSCAKKMPIDGDFRVDIDRGSRLVPVSLNRKEKEIVTQVGKHLKMRGIRLAAVDLIENFVTDFNFTSPGLIFQMEKISSENLANKIITTVSRSWK